LLNDLTALTDPLMLVLDDYHVIESAEIHQSVNFFLDHLPPRIYLVLTTRADPPLSLARRRGRMEMVEVRAADLRFTSQEALQFLNQMLKLGLAPLDVESLLRRTEGWAAGLQMAALAMQSLAAMPK
jgi:LuxR family transcriptional regulator, maltose regulon positive regulatory protein